MVAGAPRYVSRPKEEMIELGEEMMKWLAENEDYVLHLSDWYTLTKSFTYNEWKTFIQKEEFIPYYEKALKFVGRKCLNKDNNMREGAAQRFLRVYYKDVKEEEDEQVRFKADLDQEIVNPVSQDIRDGQLALMQQLKAMQSSKVQSIPMSDV